MNRVRITTAGLALLLATAGPGQAQPPTPVFKVLKVTVDTTVTRIELPAIGIIASGQAPTWTVQAKTATEDAQQNTITFNGAVTLHAEGVTVSADKMVLDKGKNMHGPIALTGKVLIVVTRDGRPIIQMSADKATLQTEETH